MKKPLQMHIQQMQAKKKPDSAELLASMLHSRETSLESLQNPSRSFMIKVSPSQDAMGP